jgi:hypothetical protein
MILAESISTSDYFYSTPFFPLLVSSAFALLESLPPPQTDLAPPPAAMPSGDGKGKVPVSVV